MRARPSSPCAPTFGVPAVAIIAAALNTRAVCCTFVVGVRRHHPPVHQVRRTPQAIASPNQRASRLIIGSVQPTFLADQLIRGCSGVAKGSQPMAWDWFVWARDLLRP